MKRSAVPFYKGRLSITPKIVHQAKRMMSEVDPLGRRKREPFCGLRRPLAAMSERVEQGVKQTRAPVFGGNTKFEEKIVSLFEPQTEIIRKGKASKPTEFGKLMKVQEAENQIIRARVCFTTCSTLPTIVAS